MGYRLHKGIVKISIFLIAAFLIILAIYSFIHFENWVSTVSGAGKPANETKLFVGHTCYVDHLNHFNIQLAPGWRADTPPDINAVAGTSTFYNYNPNEIKGNHGFYALPLNATKIEITSFNLKENQSFEQWVAELVSEVQGVDWGGQYNIIEINPKPYSVGKFDGLAFTMGTGKENQKLLINIDLRNGFVLLIMITPANSPELFDALAMLSTINTSNHDTCY